MKRTTLRLFAAAAALLALSLAPRPALAYDANLDTNNGGLIPGAVPGSASSPITPANWTYDATAGVDGKGAWYVNGAVSGVGQYVGQTLTTPFLTVPATGPVTIQFDHRFSFESGSDGGQLQVSLNGGPFVEVGSGAFTANGYNGTFGSSPYPFSGQPAWTGNSAGYGTPAYVTSTAAVTANAGDVVQFRFVAWWDDFITGTSPNWVVDNLSVTGVTLNTHVFSPLVNSPLKVPFAGGIATFTGGSLIYHDTIFLAEPQGGLYGTTSQLGGNYTRALTIQFSQPVTNVQVYAYNLSPNITTIGATAISSFGTKKIGGFAAGSTTSVTIDVQDSDQSGPLPTWNWAIFEVLTDQGNIVFPFTPPTTPAEFTFTPIADTLSAVPQGSGTFKPFNTVPSLAGDNVAFTAQSSGGDIGIYSGSGASASVIASNNTAIPGGSGNFTGFGGTGSSGAAVVFRGTGTGGQAGIYQALAGTLSKVADLTDAVPGGTGNFVSIGTNPLVSGSAVAFLAAGSDRSGLYLASGGALTKVADTATAVPGSSGNFDSFAGFAISGQNVAFQGVQGMGASATRGIYLSSGGALTAIADPSTDIPGGTGKFTTFGGVGVSGDHVVFQGSGSNGQLGIYLAAGGVLSRIADTSTAIPGGAMNFTNFGSPTISGTTVVFVGLGIWGQDALYQYHGGTLARVFGADHALGVRTMNSFIGFGTASVDGPNVAVSALFNFQHSTQQLNRVIFRGTRTPFAPDVETGAATNIARDSARVEGAVAAEGATATVTVEYDTDISDSAYEFSQPLGTTTSNDPDTLFTNLTDLTPGTLYHYRLKAVNSAGTTYGADATFTTAANAAPAAVDDTAATAFETAVDIFVTANDTDSDNDFLTIGSYTEPQHGMVSLKTDSQTRPIAFHYVPTAGFTGTDTFTYRAQDGFTQSANFATVTVTVGPPPIVDPVRTVLFTGGGGVPGAGALGSGVPDGAVWTGFGPPAIDSAGKIAFLGQWKAPGGPGAGIFFDGVLVAKSGDPSPGPGSSHLGVLRDPVLDSGGSGAVAFLATLTGADRAHDTIAISNARTDGQPGVGRLHVVAAEGEVAPDTQGARFALLSGISLHGADVAVSATLVAGTGAPRVTTASNRGVWIFPGDGTPPVVVRTGAAFNEKTIRSFDALQPTRGSLGAGRGEQLTFAGAPALAFTARFTDGSQALCVQSTNRMGFFSQTGSSDLADGATWASYGPLAFFLDPTSVLGFRATLTHGVGGVTAANDEGVFFAKQGDLNFTAIARKGQTVGESGGASFSSFLDPVLNSDGAIAFQARLRVPGAAVAYDDSVFYAAPGGPARLLARERRQPPEAPAGAQWGSFLSLAFPDHAAGPLVLAQLINHYYNGYTNGHLRPGPGGVTMTTDIGLWGMGTGGDLRLLLREGDLLNGKKVSSFTVLSTVLGSPGVTRSYNNAQDVVLRVFFVDRTQGIVRIQLPNAPSH